nr:isoform 2 of wd repeat-containing protein 26 [Quercus suber]
MGGIDDNEPPLKRPKVPLGDSNSFSGDSLLTQSAACSLGDLMARPLPSQGDEETVGSKGVIKRSEFIKIITRALYSLGYDKSGALLEEESGIPLHTSVVNLLMQQVRDGKWNESVATLHTIGDLDETTVKSASFLMLEQKFLELLRIDEVTDALDTLRNEIVPLCVNVSQVHELTACIVSPSWSEILGLSSHDTDVARSRSKILEKLQKLLPAAVMIPEKRLEHLVEQTLDVQRDDCVFHNTLDGDLSLYSDHHCGRRQIPSQTLQVLQAHRDEVWFLEFSHNGKYLASSSKDRSAIIWEAQLSWICQALFGKVFYLSELPEFCSRDSSLVVKEIFGVTDDDADKLRIHTLSEAGDMDSLEKMVDGSDSEDSSEESPSAP